LRKTIAATAYEDDLRVIAREAATTAFASLADDLYANFYCRPRESAATSSTRDERMRFLADLSLANCGTGHWEAGWSVAAREGDTMIVIRSGLRLFAHQNDVRASAELGPACRGRILVGKELRALIRGFYSAVGNADGSDDPEVPLVRLYWNLAASGASRYIALVTSTFNDAGIPFWTKVLSDPGGYVRADAGVLYVERTDVCAVAPMVHRIYDEIAPFLHDPVPMFTKRLAPGLAWAEDPGGARSFGQTRCQAIARGLRACIDRSHDLDDRYRSIRESLKAEGIDPNAPHLCGGRDEAYASLSFDGAIVQHERAGDDLS